MELQKSPYQIEIISAIKKLRVDNNYSQSQLSSLLGISVGQIGNIESLRYSHKYTLKQIYELSIHFHHPIEQIFLSEEELMLPKREIINCLITKIIEYDR